eukprot:CAMPEP_0119274414 /NCGR_PEP_ID=MMETSP1329-20130426/12050_1 /TAXON_ID=114041 /ORGANISM="Genus nov. species nov., Strain RCC1024" /LENGTH=36 /DNA_ID= /DNA_START= /DNA_END= /DNA_ORIENTATION=
MLKARRRGESDESESEDEEDALERRALAASQLAAAP